MVYFAVARRGLLKCFARKELSDPSLQEDYDLSKGESRESTSAYGLNFLEQIRRTADKKYVLHELGCLHRLY